MYLVVQEFKAIILEKIDVQCERVLPRYAANHETLQRTTVVGVASVSDKASRDVKKHNHVALFMVKKAIDPI